MVAECAVSSGAGAEKGAPRETDTAAAADVSEESGRSGGNGRSGAADEPENGGADMAVGSDEAAAARQSEAGVTKAAVEKAVEEVFGEAVGRGASGRDCSSGGDCAEHGTESDRIIREYEKIAFADASLGEIKVSDKLRALDQYRAMCERRNDGGEISLVVNYDYGE